ncbi:MAG: redox-sensing transcriptional repressor Rex [Thermoanaerobaculia bacterium]|nr:redox-sensing transcriptional repressor Rex [Thermoanaerobaculia bacterium]
MASGDTPPLALNRLSVYLRALRALQREGIERISSQRLASRFGLSAPQIRKDLAQYGEFGIRGIGYDVVSLRRRLEHVLGLDRRHAAVIVGAGNIGTALARFPGLNTGAFHIVAVFDIDPKRIGARIGDLTVRDPLELAEVVESTGADMGILAVPAEAAAENYFALVGAGVRAVLNFAPVRLEEVDGVRVKDVDLTIFLEELAHHLVSSS